MPNNSLNKLINDIPVDQDFKEQAKKIGLNTLNDVMEIDIAILKSHPDFSYIWFATLLQVLEQEKLLDAFQARLY